MTQSETHPHSLNPFQLPGKWYRGNLHTHTTQSDGALSPAQAAAWYADHGYDFVAITDHEIVTNPALAEPSDDSSAEHGRLLVLPGIEIELGPTRQGSPLHMVAVGLPNGAPHANVATPAAALTSAWDAGAFAFVAHPHWSGMSTDELASLGGVRAIEAFNYGSDRENHKGWATVYWDDVLGRGQRISGVATDDSHFEEADHGGAWVMVKTNELTASAIIGALRSGHFYSSCGPVIRDIRVVGSRLTVQCSPASAIYWIGAGSTGWHVHAAARQALVSAEFDLRNSPDWIRIEVCNAQQRCAWSNPLFLQP